MRPPPISQDTFENRAKYGVDANLRIRMIDEEADSILGNAKGFRVDLRHHVSAIAKTPIVLQTNG